MNINLNSLPGAVKTADSDLPVSKDSSRLKEAAKQFESLMISQMMKTARETSSGGWLSEGDQTGEDSSMSMAEEQFAQSLASNGGLGLAKMVVRTMSRVEGNATPPALEPVKP